MSNVNQPSAKVIADKLGEMVEAEMDEKCQKYIVADQNPDEWVNELKKVVTKLFLEENERPPEVKEKK